MKNNRVFVLITSLLAVCVWYWAVAYINFLPNLRTRHRYGMKLTTAVTHGLSRRLEDFRRDWFRQRRARVDWQSIIKPCSGNMEWGLVKNYWGRENRSSPKTSEVVYQDIRPAGEFSKVFIQSKTAGNRTKTIGGDYWRIYVRGPSSVGATVFDHENGTYEVLFLLTEPGDYQLMIYLDYSLCDGLKEPPPDWFIQGNAQGKWQKEGLLGTLDEYLMAPFKDGKPFIITVPKADLIASFIGKLQHGHGSCTKSCNHLWDGFGQWKDNTWRPYLEEPLNWSLPEGYQRRGALWIYGDSLGLYLMNSVKSGPLCQKLYLQCENSYNWIYPEKEVPFKKQDNRDFRPEIVIADILRVLRLPLMQKEESAMLLNLGLHFPRSITFTRYQQLITDLIHGLKETEVDLQGNMVPKYKAKVIWKTSTAIHKETVEVRNRTCWRFFTTHRVALFNAFASSAMCEAGFDVIDVHPISESYPQGTLDQVHYTPNVFGDVEVLLEKYKVHSNKKLGTNETKSRIKRCIT